jgi:hypothetical protein
MACKRGGRGLGAILFFSSVPPQTVGLASHEVDLTIPRIGVQLLNT